MEIVSIKSKALKRLILNNDARLLPAQYVPKIRRFITLLRDFDGIEEFLAMPKGKPHRLKGDRANTYSVFISKNWRITFEYIEDDNSVHILDFEDYH
ncbi:MAG: plasmid maintenance system killer [Robiginitomaculum sp.]|nr:MAG: plasmid maintenance system killer [Robiginitomaculum sp.]